MSILQTYLVYFIVFSGAGWLLEMIYRSVTNKRFMNPGFLHGPWLPIYGVGSLMVIMGHTFLDSYSFGLRVLLYFFFLTGLEFVTGFLTKKMFNIRLWDYSDQPFNIQGHICLGFAFAFTFIAAGLDFLADFISYYAMWIFASIFPVSYIMAIFLLLLFCLDYIFSVKKHIDNYRHSFDKHELKQEFLVLAKKTLVYFEVMKLQEYNHHSGKTRLDHVIDVAWLSFKLSKYLSLDSDAIVRGALLHDLFYYDWLREGPRLHGFRHSRIALHNARKIMKLSKKEEDIILKHMWPLTVVFPRYSESWIVCLVDSYCSIQDYIRPLILFLSKKGEKLKVRGWLH